MKGYRLYDKLAEHFAKDGTASSEVMVIDRGTGKVFKIVDIITDREDDGSTTHWLEVEEPR